MTTVEIVMVILMALALGFQIAGSEVFRVFTDERAEADLIRFGVVAWSCTFVLGILLFLSSSYPVTVRILGASLALVSAGGLYWKLICMIHSQGKKLAEKYTLK